ERNWVSRRTVRGVWLSVRWSTCSRLYNRRSAASGERDEREAKESRKRVPGIAKTHRRRVVLVFGPATQQWTQSRRICRHPDRLRRAARWRPPLAGSARVSLREEIARGGGHSRTNLPMHRAFH